MNKCPNCHFENKAGAKFCTKCGTALANSNSTMSTSTEKHESNLNNKEPINIDVSTATNNFFNYFINSLTHPITSKVGNDSYLGIVSLVTYVVLSFLGIFSLASSFLNTNGLNISNSLNPLPNGLGITMAITSLTIWIIIYLCTSSIMKNKIPLSIYNNNFGKFLNIGSTFLLVGSILSLILPSLLSLAFILVIIGYLPIILGSAYELFTTNNQSKFESFYIALIALIIIFIINYICLRLFVLQPLQNNLSDLTHFI